MKQKWLDPHRIRLPGRANACLAPHRIPNSCSECLEIGQRPDLHSSNNQQALKSALLSFLPPPRHSKSRPSPSWSARQPLPHPNSALLQAKPTPLECQPSLPSATKPPFSQQKKAEQPYRPFCLISSRNSVFTTGPYRFFNLCLQIQDVLVDLIARIGLAVVLQLLSAQHTRKPQRIIHAHLLVLQFL